MVLLSPQQEELSVKKLQEFSPEVLVVIMNQATKATSECLQKIIQVSEFTNTRQATAPLFTAQAIKHTKKLAHERACALLADVLCVVGSPSTVSSFSSESKFTFKK
jgi:hypothetical protein